MNAINARAVDLLVPFRSRWLYHPNQHSSASIKAVLPAFTDLRYDDLDISDGGEAMLEYENFIKGKLDERAAENLWSGLKEYCKQDTLAMVRLLEVLKRYENKILFL